jgi:hypothetical protein
VRFFQAFFHRRLDTKKDSVKARSPHQVKELIIFSQVNACFGEEREQGLRKEKPSRVTFIVELFLDVTRLTLRHDELITCKVFESTRLRACQP